MKRTQRLSIEVRHREVTITVEGSVWPVQDSDSDVEDTLPVCPVCGSPWIDVAARAEGDAPAGVARLRDALQRFGLHMQVSPAGQVRICRKTYEEIKEKL